MALLERFVTACATAPERAAIIEGDKRIPFPELLKQSIGLSLLLREHDPSPHGHVGLLLPNIAAFPACHFGALLADKVSVPINVLLQPSEIAFILRDAEIHTVLTISLFKPLFEKMGDAVGWKVNAICLDELPPAPEGITPPPIEKLISHERPDDLAVLVYTSGTTGNPKGVMLTYNNLESNYEGSSKVLELREFEDVVVAQLPLFHSFGLMATLLCPVLDQTPIVMLPRFNPTQLLRAIAEHHISALCLVAPMYGLLCRHPKIRETDLSSLRLCVSGGGPLPPPIEQGWKALTGSNIVNGYGLTEASPVVAHNSPYAMKAGTIGKPLHNVTVEIRDANNSTLPIGEEGEICVQGPSLMKGYLNRPDETKETFTSDGWLKTGDLGNLDDEGYITITGRAKELIIFGGENIMPLEIENALVSHPAIREAAVIGMHDEEKGEVPVAAIVLEEGQSVEPPAIREFLKDKIAPFKIPREFRVLEELPKNTLNKVLKNQLREMLQSE